MRYLTILLCACTTEIGVSDTCDSVGKYALCSNYVEYEQAWSNCSAMEMVLANWTDPDGLKDSNQYRELYLLGQAEFNGESYWLDDVELDCTIMEGTYIYVEPCHHSHPFICEVWD